MKATTTGFFNIVIVLLALVNFNSNAQTYNLVWSDEFNGSISNAWRHEIGGGGWGNNEKQYYQPNNAYATGSELIITAKKENVGGMPYTSSRLITNGSSSPKSFKYGRMEARMRLPMGQGLWPAFWMLGTNIGSVGWPSCGEIDIMEHINNDATVFGTIHWQGPNGYATYGSNSPGTSPANYHTYRVDWNANDIRWFIDGAQYHIVSIANSVNSTEEFHRPMYFILNLAVAGNFPGQTVDESRLPATMAVDYVRVYKAGASTFSQTIEAESYIAMSGIQTEGCSEGGLNVGWIDAGDWMAYNVNIPTSGTYKVSYRVSSPNSGKSLKLEKDNGQTLLGTVSIPNTGGWQNWTSVSHNVYLPAGSYAIGLATGTGGFNINRFHLTNNLNARLAPEEVSIEKVPATTLFYPNPVINKLNISNAFNESASVQVLDFSGNVVKKASLSNGEKEIDMADLASGGYLIRVTSEGTTKVEKVYKE
ncbi:MAG TPA: carbohydrate-binding protein [Cytophagales bacterium]|nr:carbohydrate-binding protein [Cytophagales bacterium]